MGDLSRDEIDARFASLRAEMQAGFAEARVEMQKNTTAIIKWVVGMVFGAGAVAITVMTFVLNNAVPKAPTPIIIPAPAHAPTAAPANGYLVVPATVDYLLPAA